MTTIAAVQGDGWSVIGYDSRVSEEDGRSYILPKDNAKVFKNGHYIIGVAGDMRAINILAHVFKPPTCTATTLGIKLDKFMTAVFIPELKETFEKLVHARDLPTCSTSFNAVRVTGNRIQIVSSYVRQDD